MMDANKKVKGFYWEGGGYFVMDWFYEKLDNTVVEPKKWTGRYNSEVFKRDINMRIHRRTGKLRLKPVFFFELSP